MIEIEKGKSLIKEIEKERIINIDKEVGKKIEVEVRIKKSNSNKI